MKISRKIFSIIIMMSMLLSLLPMKISASISAPEKVISSGKIYIYANGTSIVVKEDGIYDNTGKSKLISIDVSTIECIFGGTKDAGTSVTSTKVVLESGSVNKIYGGGNNGNVEGLSEVIINGGFCNTLYGGCNYGTAGRTRVELNNSSDKKMALVMGGALKADVLGDIDIVLNNPNLTSLAGGNNSGGNIAGDINITINGGSIDKIFGGSAASNSYVKGAVNIILTGNTTFGFFQPMGKSVVTEGVYKVKGGDRVDGGANVYIPRTFTEEQIANIQTNDNICVFYNDGEQISGTPSISSDTTNKNVFANGASVTLKTYEADGKTYIYNSSGTKQLLKFPIDGYTIYGGSPTQEVASTNVTMESGRVAAIYGGGLNGQVTGNSFVAVNGGVIESVYGSGLNGTVNATAHIKIAEGASVTGSVYSNSVTGNTKASVIWVPENFAMNKVLPGGNVRIFKGDTELMNTNILIPGTVTVQDRYVFANGIPITIKKDSKDGRTYIYDSTGTTKLLATEVNGMEVYGGSLKGVVASTYVTMESGTVARIYGGGYTGSVTGIAKVSITGGDITEVVYGGSYDGDVGGTDIYTKGPHVAKGIYAGSRNGCVLGDTKMVLIDSVAKGLYAGTGGEGRGAGYPDSDVLGSANCTIVGGMFESLYGGCKSGVIKGTSTITLEGQVIIKTAMEPLSQSGVMGGATVYVPENFTYIDKIKTGAGITIQRTAAVEPEPVPEVLVQTAEVMAFEGDRGKLVFRFINIPEPNGNLKGRPGEAYYITFPNGSNMLVDAGGDTDSSGAILTGFLDGMGVKDINYVVASHYHEDHIGRMAEILAKYNIGTFYTTGYDVPFTGAYYRNLRTWMSANSDKVVNLWKGDQLTIDGVQIEVLNPENDPAEIAKMNTGPSTEDVNNNSIVMKLTYGNHTALLTGDLYVSAEKKLIEMHGADKLKSDLLKVPHHGDTTSSDPEFAAAVSPKIAVIPDFADTRIVNNRYREVGADTYVTGIDGIVKVAFDGVNDAEVMTEYYVPVPASMEVTGGSDIIYVDNTTETVIHYTYSVHDQYGKIINNTPVIRTLTDDQGNLINDPAITFENDTLTVKGRPQAAYVVVNFLCGSSKASKRVAFTNMPLSNYTVAIDGPDELSVTTAEDATATYTPVVKNGKGEVITGIPVEMSLTTYTGLNATFTSADNKLVVSRGSSSGTLKLNAVFKGTSEVVAEKSVKVTAAKKKGGSSTSSATPAATPTPTATPNPTPTPTEPNPESTTKPTSKDTFGDVRNHWADKYIHVLADKGIILGKGENKFEPEGKMTRAEFASIIARAFKLSEGAETAFTDIQSDAWYAKSIEAAFAAGILRGKSEGIFAPEDSISREEMAVIVSRVYKFAKGEEVRFELESAFTDASEISAWAIEDIATIYSLGLVKGSEGGFAPKEDMTRAEGATIIYNLLVKLGSI